MCLAIPGEILAITDNDPLTRTGKVSFGGVVKDINLSLVPDADVGDFVIVHVGFAISRLDEEEARRTLEYLGKLEGEPPDPEEKR